MSGAEASESAVRERLPTATLVHLATHGKAEALRRAQEEVRGEPGSRFHDPRYWSGFR